MLHVWMLVTMLVAAAGTQGLPKGQLPDGWAVRVDGAAGAAATDLVFVVMKPGWHITTGPSVVLYQPTQTASGTYALKSEIFLFDPGARNEAFGVLLGGRNLERDDQAYTYFMIRRTGEFLIKRRAGGTTATVKDWTPAASIRRFEDRVAGQSSVKNTLEVAVAADTTTFLVNGIEVAHLPTRDIDTNGLVGLRVNHQLNLHVSALEIVK